MTFLNGYSASEELSLAAVDRQGRPFRCHIVMTILTNEQGGRNGVVLTMEADDN